MNYTQTFQLFLDAGTFFIYNDIFTLLGR